MKEHPCECEKCLLALSHAKEEGAKANFLLYKSEEAAFADGFKSGDEVGRAVAQREVAEKAAQMFERWLLHDGGFTNLADEIRSLSDLPPKE